MSIKQFNATYFKNDDRVLFRFNTLDNSEYKFWFTRRVTHFILMAINQLLEIEHEKNSLPAVEKTISEFQQQAIKDTTNLATPYEPGTQYPMGADAILVVDVQCEMIKIEDQNIFSLNFILPGGGNVNLKLPIPIMHTLVLLLQQLNVQAKWGEPMNTSFQQSSEIMVDRKMH